MRILHTADWHLGIELHKVSLIDDQRYFFSQLYQLLEQEQIDVIIVAGDIYDTALANKEALRLYNEVMTKICLQLKIQVIVIAGNHDSPDRLAAMNQLLKNMGVYVIGRMEEKIEPILIQDTAFYPVPYFHMESYRNAYESNAKTYEQAYQEITRQAMQDPYETKILIAHTFCANAALSESDRFASLGGSDLVSASVFDGFDYVALGHLHRLQSCGDSVFYSGSPLPYSFSEAKYEKAVLIYDTKRKKITQKNITPLHPLFTLRDTFENLQAYQKENLDPNAYYRVELLDAIVSFETMDYFKEQIPNLLQLSGKNAVLSNTVSIEVEAMEQMDDIEIVKSFFKDLYEQELGEEEISWLKEALERGESDVA